MSSRACEGADTRTVSVACVDFEECRECGKRIRHDLAAHPQLGFVASCEQNITADTRKAMAWQEMTRAFESIARTVAQLEDNHDTKKKGGPMEADIPSREKERAIANRWLAGRGTVDPSQANLDIGYLLGTIDRLRGIIDSLTARAAAQSELLSKRAEKR